jgi:hypothetical protein
MSASHREDVDKAQTRLPYSLASGERLQPNNYWGKAFQRLDKQKQHRIKQALEEKQEAIEESENVDTDDAEDTTHKVQDGLFTTDGSTPAWPDILSEICRQQQGDQKIKSRKFRFAGRDVNLRTTMENWIEFFNRIKKIGDIAVNVDPLHAGLLRLRSA